MSTRVAMELVHIKGSHRQMGQQLGEACAPAIHRMLAIYKDTFVSAYDEIELTWDEAVLQSLKYYPFAQEYTPQYVEELEGMAEAAEVDFDDLMVLNCMEAITADALHLGCTSFALSAERTENGHVLVGHNEDWLPEDEENTYLIHATPEDETPFIAITYGGLLPNIGFNANGIAQCCDSVYPTDVRIGVPRIFASRGALGARNLGDAIRKSLLRSRAAGYNHLLADRNGELYNVEVSAHHFATMYGLDGFIGHSNHYLTNRMKQYESKVKDLIDSRIRVNRITRLVRGRAKHSVESIKAILSDHMDHPQSVCYHQRMEDDESIDRKKTIASLIMDLTTLELHVAWGNPCQNDYQIYQLEA
jgi:isopenicillin-N N-acyltransferase-like protein